VGLAPTGKRRLSRRTPGTGKTEFAKTLGAHVGFSVRSIGEANDDNAQNGNERVAALMIASAVVGVARRTLLVVDEADDLFLGGDAGEASQTGGSEAIMNRFFKRMTVPTIWIANDADRLGAAIVRRMNLALRFPRLRLSARKAVVARIAKGHGLRLDDASADTLARARVAPTLIENAIRSATHFGGSARDAAIILSAGLRALGRSEPLHAPTPIPFDPALSSADVSQSRSRRRSRSSSLALRGPASLRMCAILPSGSISTSSTSAIPI